jgi:hypothetical protein
MLAAFRRKTSMVRRAEGRELKIPTYIRIFFTRQRVNASGVATASGEPSWKVS